MAKLPDSSINEQKHIFISYSSTDRAFVDRLAEDLRARGHVVWIDFQGIRGGDQWKQSIADGLHASKVVLLVLSPESVASEWVEEEMRKVLELRTARDLKIIPLLLRAVTDIKQPSIQWIYQEIQYIDFTKGHKEPFERLLVDLPQPERGVAGHCQKIIAEIAAAPWGLDHYIQGEAKILPIDASPYEGGMVKKNRENLLYHLWNNRRTIVLGEPGVGKSVALERLAWELANQRMVPITVRLLQYDGDDLLKWIRLDLIRHHEIDLKTIDEARDFLNDPRYPCYFLLDGLNEVRPEHREAVIAQIEQLSLEYQHPLVVSSRIQDEGWQRLRQGRAFQHIWVVQTITEDQARGYLAGHLGAADSAKLWGQLDGRMRGLVQTPLLLWMLKEAWREARETKQGAHIRMPDNRGELYQNFVARMLRRENEKRLNQQVAERARTDALRKLAAVLHHRQALTISSTEAETMVGDGLILEVLKVNGLLTGDAELRFAPHQTIQEHFAALALRDGIDVKGVVKLPPIGASQLPKFIAKLTRSPLNYAEDAWWSETFIQLAGLTADPNTLAQRIAAYNPWLAWWCVSEGKQVDPATQKAIEKQSIALVSSSDVRDRLRAAQALARIQSDRVIDPLAQLSVDEDQTVSQTAAAALWEIGEAGTKAIEDAFANKVASMDIVTRAEWGRTIAAFDPRPGVIQPVNGLEDIAWSEVIPAGEFLYGEDKQPITIEYAYQISKYPITYAQFETFLSAPDGYASKRFDWFAGMAADEDDKRMKGGRFNHANHPLVDVNWYQALAFCRWLSWIERGRPAAMPALEDVLKWPVRLPTEHEWEKAARGTDGRLYPWGDAFDSANANTRESGIGMTSAVGLFPLGTSPYGALDLSGNVWEWCLTEYRSGINTANTSESRALRGGSWFNDQDLAACASRNNYFPYYGNSYFGFRVVVVPLKGL